VTARELVSSLFLNKNIIKMKAEEYLKQSGYNENWPIRSAQICRLMEGYAQAQLKEEREDKKILIDQINGVLLVGDDYERYLQILSSNPK
jgi:hypothetical protein